MVPLRGELVEGALPGVLRAIYLEGRTGMLQLHRGEERGSVCFIRGAIAYGDTNIKECHMGETLVRHGLLTQRDLDRALETMPVTGRRLGEILADLGLFDRDGLDEALALQVREVLLTIFGWREGRYEFQEQDAAYFRGYGKLLKLSTGEVILDAVWSIASPETIRYGLGDLDRLLVPATDPLLRFQRVTLTSTDGLILSRVDGTLTARQTLELTPVGREEAERSLFGLLHIGIVDYARDRGPALAPAGFQQQVQVLEAWSSLEHKSHHEVLGVAPNASTAAVHAAWIRLARQFHPDARHEPGLHDLHDKLVAIFARVNEAHRALTAVPARSTPRPAPAPAAPPPAAEPTAPPAPPAASPAAADPAQAEATLARAQQALEAGRAREARTLLAELYDRLSGRQRRRARVLRAQALLKDPDDPRAAEEELKAAIAEDPTNADAYFVLGTIYKASGAHVLAASQFRKVLALRPRHAAAIVALAETPSQEPKTRGLLKKLFGY